jgi:thiol-disulfide isomerase/thioredoxin
MKRHLFVLLSILFLTFVSPVYAYLQQGETAPDFELFDAHGRSVKLSDYAGKVVVLKLATTWCPTCKQQTEEIESVAKELNAGDIVVLDVFLQDTQDMVDDYLPQDNVISNFVPLLDDGRVRESYNVYLIPRLLLVDQQQKIQRDGGLMPASELKKQVQVLLGN